MAKQHYTNKPVMYAVTCNGVRFTSKPLTWEEAEKYMKLRQGEMKPGGREPTYGGKQNWNIVPF